MKSILSIGLALSAFCAVSAQKVSDSKIPAAAKQSFIQKYPGVAGKWEKEENNYEVNFKKDGKTMSVVIDEKGTILETETGIAVKSLPADVISYIRTHYNGAAIKEAAQIVKTSGETVYEAQVNKTDFLFDANGKFIKKAKD